MRESILELVLLSVPLVFFGVLQASRPMRQYRLWLAGWVLVVLSIALWAWEVESPEWGLLQECLRFDLLICGALAFLISFAPQNISWKRINLYIVCLAIAPCFVVSITNFGVTSAWLLMTVVLLGETLAAFIASRVLHAMPATMRALQLLCVLFAGLLLVLAFGRQDMMVSIILAQIFCSCAILILNTPGGRTASSWMAAIGFVSWAAFHVASQMMHNNFPIASPLWKLWNVPKYLLGFGMVMRVLEVDTVHIQSLSEEYRLLYEANPHPMWIFDPGTRNFLSVNNAAIAEYGYSREEFMRMSLYDIRPVDDHAQHDLQLKRNADSEQKNWRHRRKDGTLFDVDITGHDVFFQGREARFVMAVDITERERLNRELVYTAQHDGLTGLANRMLLEDRAQQALARSARDGQKVALLTIDVDRFKQINDTYGHPVGDECLRAISTRLLSRVREADTLARTGGEEFTILISSLGTVRGAESAAAALLQAMKEPLTLSTNQISVSISIGIALFPDHGSTLDIVRKRSDKALYQAKRMGGNRAMTAAQDSGSHATSAVDIEGALRDAIKTDNLQLAYQPIFDVTGKLARVEALVRGVDPLLAGIGPNGFIPVAEESGLILPLGKWVLQNACRQMAAWRAQGMPTFQFAVNVSARQLVQQDFATQVIDTLNQHGLSPGLLHLELTETTLMRDLSSIAATMERLAGVGVLFSIDDFGTGYSSLARLSELPLSTIKIDRSFIAKLLHSDAAVGIVRAIVHMSQHLQMELVAEGVEAPEHLALLLDLGCHMFQGFCLCKPLSVQAMTDWLHTGALGFDPEQPIAISAHPASLTAL